MSGVKRVGGVQIGGSASVARPSPAGEFRGGIAQVNFDRDEFTAALHDKGYDVIWERSSYCPNRGGITKRDHKIDCTICEGDGFLYHTPTPTRMMMTSINLSQSYFAQGRWDSGSQMVTALPEFRLHPFDRLVLLNGVARFEDMQRRQPRTLLDRPKYKPLCVEYLTWVDRTGALRVFKENVDFSINSDGYLVWDNDVQRPDDNDYYAISYTYRPQYIVTELMHQHRDSTVGGVHYEFPVQAMAKLDFLVRDESKDAPEDNDTSPFPSR